MDGKSLLALRDEVELGLTLWLLPRFHKEVPIGCHHPSHSSFIPLPRHMYCRFSKNFLLQRYIGDHNGFVSAYSSWEDVAAHIGDFIEIPAWTLLQP